jgi:ABC-2 type transport system permease protein
MKSTPRLIVAVVCLIVSAVCAAMIVEKIVGGTRLDLTQHRVYTLTQGTRNILGEIAQPLTLTLYYSRTAAMKGPEQIRYWNNYYLYVRGLLEEYARLAKGRVRLLVVDPRPYSDDEEAAKTSGVKRFALSEDEGFFFGLVVRTELGKEKVIPFFEPERQEFVEYDVSKVLSDAIHPEKQKLGILSSLQVMGMADLSPYMLQMMQMQGRMPPPPWAIVERLREQYDVVSVPTETESVASDVNFLLVIHPKKLPEKTLFAIDQYVMRGGKLAVFVDPFCMADRPEQGMGMMGGDQSSNLNALLEKWGVTMEAGIAGDRALAGRVRDGKLVTFLNLTAECATPAEVVSAKLHAVRMYFAGALRRVGGATTVTPLFSTTAAGNLWNPESPWELQNPDPTSIAKQFRDGAEPRMLACRITGVLESNFPDGLTIEDKPPEDATDTPAATRPTTRTVSALARSAAENTVLVFADVDLLADYLAYQESFFGMAKVGDNESVVLNAVDFLAGSNDLIGIRSRGRLQRPFDRVDKIEAEADRASADEIAALEAQIRAAQERLNKLTAPGGESQKVIAGAVAAEREKVQNEIYRAEKSIRQIKDRRRVKIEGLKARLQVANLALAPTAILVIAVALWTVQRLTARRYAARRNAE